MFTSSSLVCADYFCNKISLCLSTDNTVYSFGFSSFGAHGHEENNILSPKQIKGLYNIKLITCSDVHCICINYNGDCFSFGNNDKGQLGIGNSIQCTHIPQHVNLPPIKQVSCGLQYTICLSEDGFLFSFGANSNGQLGLEDTQIYSFPQKVPSLTNVEFIECGGSHSICKTYRNEFFSWGLNSYGQLGQDNTDDCNKPIQCLNWPENIIDIKSGAYHTLLLTEEGIVYSFGAGSVGQLGIQDYQRSCSSPKIIEKLPIIKRVSTGYNHSMCIDYENRLWIFGYNHVAQLGLGDKKDKYKPILHPNIKDIYDISYRANHVFIKTLDNKIYGFGCNDSIQLGIETSNKDQITPIQILKDNEDIWCSFIGKSRAKSARK